MGSKEKKLLNPVHLINAYPQYFMLVVVLLVGLFGIPFSTWVTLTVAGLGMGMMIFVMASGMTLTFGLMDVLNLGHGALITAGAFFGATVVTGLGTGRWPIKLLAGLHVRPSSQTLWGIGAFSTSLVLMLIISGILASKMLRADTKQGAFNHPYQLLILFLSNIVGAASLWVFSGWSKSGFWPSELIAALTAFAAGLIVSWLTVAYRANRSLPPLCGSASNQSQLGLIGAGTAVVSIFTLHSWDWSHNFVANMGILVPGFLIAFIGVGIVGYVFERLIIKPVYGDSFKQILVTVGAMYIIDGLLKVYWGPDQIPMSRPSTLTGGLSLGNISVEKYRLLAGVIGLIIYWILNAIINRTKVGILIRAGVENTEMVEALGYRIKLLYVTVFVSGAALAGMGGAMWGLYQGVVSVGLGSEMLVLIIIVIIIGGMGSIAGCLYGALLVGLLNNYMIYMLPKVALFSSVLLMVIVLMWRPQGLKPLMK